MKESVTVYLGKYMHGSNASTAKAFAKFDRRLTAWDTFQKAAESPKAHWFKDLLSLWRPSGFPSGDDGLRIAIRNEYINFYRLGQSVARVSCRGDELVAEVHYKYVLNAPRPERNTALYLRLTNEGVLSGARRVALYEGMETLLQWVSVAGGMSYAGDEKTIVDELVGENDNIIDLEMALPAWSQRSVADRIDLVGVESGKVVFWEVKTVNDSRIRCRAEFERDKFPHVLKQLANYRDFLREDAHVAQVERAYRNAARLLVELIEVADAVRPRRRLGNEILAAAEADKLTVSPLAGLVVVDTKEKAQDSAWKSWKASHEGKLLGRIPMVVLQRPGELKFTKLDFHEDTQ